MPFCESKHACRQWHGLRPAVRSDAPGTGSVRIHVSYAYFVTTTLEFLQANPAQQRHGMARIDSVLPRTQRRQPVARQRHCC